MAYSVRYTSIDLAPEVAGVPDANLVRVYWHVEDDAAPTVALVASYTDTQVLRTDDASDKVAAILLAVIAEAEAAAQAYLVAVGLAVNVNETNTLVTIA